MKKYLVTLFLLAAAVAAGKPAAAQSLPSQVLALYPQRTGELVFVDLRALRASRHYLKIKAQVLPDRFRQLENWVQVMGIDFEREVRQLSWAFVPAADGPAISFVGVAEGTFTLSEVERMAGKLKLAVRRSEGATVVTLGKNDQGQDFVFAFLDGSTAVFGLREAAQEILTRRAQGGASVLDNATMKALLPQLNGRAPLWIALDRQFSGLALKQMLPEASQVAGFDQAVARLQNTALRFELKDGLRTLAAVRCQDASDAVLFNSAAQAAVAYQALRVNEANPELARVLGQVRITRQEDRLDIELSMAEPDLVALLQKNSFAIKF